MSAWIRYGAWKHKATAKRLARGLRAKGEDKVRAKIVKEVWWRVEYAWEIK